MANQSDVGLFLPSTYVYDVVQLQSVDVKSPEFKELIIRLYQNVNNIILALNQKESAKYPLTEFNTGQTFFPDPALSSTTPQTPTERNVIRIVLNFGALPNTGTKSMAHGVPIDTNYKLTRLYGASTNPTATINAPEMIPLPYSSATLNDNIELYADNTNVYVITATDWSAYTITYIVLEYIKQ
jgi:hypothetical protein